MPKSCYYVKKFRYRTDLLLIKQTKGTNNNMQQNIDYCCLAYFRNPNKTVGYGE